MPRSTALATLLANLTCLVFCGALVGCLTPLRERPAVLVNSERFEIFSTMSAEDTQALALELERFHALIYAITNAPDVTAVVPTRIYAFDRQLDYQKFAPRGSAGYFAAGMRENRIVLADYASKLGASEIILHEYVHFVLRHGTLTRLPIWYDEGFAEFLSTARPHEDMIAMGAFPMARAQAFQELDWVEMSRIISATSYDDLPGEDRYMLYPESWALVHYLFLGREAGSRPVGEAMVDYLDRVERGEAPPEAFGEAFGEQIDKVGRKIQRNLEHRRLRMIGIPLSNLDYDTAEPRVRRLSPQESAMRIGWLAVTRDEGELAEEHFRYVVESEPQNARAHAGLGDALLRLDRLDEAELHYRRAVELDPGSALNHLDLAEFLEHRGGEEKLGPKRTALFAEARTAYQRSLELDPSIPETWAMLGGSHLAPGEKPALGLEPITRALTMLPSSPHILEMMAEAELAVGRERLAREWIVKAHAARIDGDFAESVDEKLDALREARAEAERKARPAPGDESAGAGASN